ncbi:MAG: HPr(Ser) kinase/phosphatase [Alkalibacterium sp.]|uniref:HPr kinase/phosphorylase n=1 Tax=Alkalibacterium gilvum TaxID=1130080 RepID=A0A1H6SQR3_9LACT|nr:MULTISPECIES: HPr(Ser) kinase/phosphatase [Alkalibacterium]MDN6293024.1 HPr(Ser) kinase/phosphatase [Alkalibacterium sp.]MDN6294955.1 HPr(Ser) kinase/phosphatase [Alkalibacterium sp.]MDN6327083.1 HPr(Ser) kinase/phosphatase [Alkalibacterium sp.]MDN6385281.1 HPr(Ser) kinase/phosphatase [Alkalibacterium sp.]MDN6397524.1 HPr(Ser) kinase/phosphatase [Alkalibacterium sp.]
MATSVKIHELVESMDDIRVVVGEENLDREILVSDLSRPALELTGYFNFYPIDRVQLLGKTELSFTEKMTSDERYIVMKRMCQAETPAFLVSRNQEPPKELLKAAEEKGIPVLLSKRSTTRLSSNVTNFLEEHLAERISQHGVLVDMYGMGVLIIGGSGIGKSETALELIQRGHRLVADDRVELYMMDERRIIGEPPEILRNLIEIRGVGVIDVVNLFGVGSIRTKKRVDLIINLEHWDRNKKYDRLGYNLDKMSIFNVDIPKLSIPVRVGRNLSIIIEIATMNIRAKEMGYDATKTFENNLNKLIEKNTREE